jgi:hypothetical protein
MEPYYFWMSGMWIFPAIGIICMIVMVVAFVFGSQYNGYSRRTQFDTDVHIRSP